MDKHRGIKEWSITFTKENDFSLEKLMKSFKERISHYGHINIHGSLIYVSMSYSKGRFRFDGWEKYKDYKVSKAEFKSLFNKLDCEIYLYRNEE